MIIVVIPAYNEEKFIEDVVKKSSKYADFVIVADDKSQDETSNLAKKAGAMVVRSVSNYRGAGKNTWRGIEKALFLGADIIVTLDGDGQHNPDEIPRLVYPILKGEADFVVGSRFINYKSIPLYRRFGISTITYVFNLFKKVKTSDAQCGYRAYSEKIFDKVEITERGFGFSIETLVKIRANGYKFAEVPIECIYHGDIKLNSSMHPIKHGLQVLWKVLYWRFKVEICGKN